MALGHMERGLAVLGILLGGFRREIFLQRGLQSHAEGLHRTTDLSEI